VQVPDYLTVEDLLTKAKEVGTGGAAEAHFKASLKEDSIVVTNIVATENTTTAEQDELITTTILEIPDLYDAATLSCKAPDDSSHPGHVIGYLNCLKKEDVCMDFHPVDLVDELGDPYFPSCIAMPLSCEDDMMNINDAFPGGSMMMKDLCPMSCAVCGDGTTKSTTTPLSTSTLCTCAATTSATPPLKWVECQPDKTPMDAKDPALILEFLQRCGPTPKETFGGASAVHVAVSFLAVALWNALREL